MKPLRILFSLAVFASTLAFAQSQASAADKLSDVLKESKMDGIVGDWVDPETKEKKIMTRFAWKIKDRVLEVTTKNGEMVTTALMGVNGKTGEVFHMGADSDGTSSIGTWTVPAPGEAVLGIIYTTSAGQEGGLSIRHKLIAKDTLLVTIELPQLITYKLVRVKK